MLFKFYLISKTILYRSIHAKVGIIILFIIILNIISFSAGGKLYHFDNASGYLDSNWKSNTLSKWNPTLDANHPRNSFLTTTCEGQDCRRYLSTEIEGDGSSTLTFDWKKIGEYAEFVFYFDNGTDKGDVTICSYYNDLHPVNPITIPLGHHVATWDLRIRPDSRNGIAGSQAWLDNINIPEINISEPNYTINAPSEVCSNSTYESSIPNQEGATYTWEVRGCIPKSPLNIPKIVWTSGISGVVNLKVTVIKNGSTYYSIRNVTINPYCNLIVPPGKDLQAIINNSTNRVLYLQEGIYGGSEGPKYPIHINSNVSNITIKSLPSIRGQVELNCGESPYAIGLIGTSNITIENLTISMCSLGIHIKNSQRCAVINNIINFSSFYSNSSGICIDNSSNNIIQDNFIGYSGRGDQNIAGFSLYNSQYNHLLRNHVDLPPDKFVFVFENSSNNSLSYYINEGHIYEDGVECNETWDRCAVPCASCSDPLFVSRNHWWYL